MPSLDGTVAKWMRAHPSTLSTEQLARLGVTEAQRRNLVRDGVLERVVDGAYRFVGVEPDELSRCLALCASREPWVRPYRTALIDADDVIVRIDGIRITTPSRTVIDLTRWLTDEEVATATEYVLSEGLCTYDSLIRCAERLNTPGRPWVRRLVRVLEGRRPGQPRESDWERRVCDALITRGVADLQCQVYESLPGYGNVRFDFAIPALWMVIEVDVHPEHRTLEGRAGDCRRDRTFRRVGRRAGR